MEREKTCIMTQIVQKNGKENGVREKAILSTDIKDKGGFKLALIFDKNNKQFLVPIDRNFENVMNKKTVVEVEAVYWVK